MTPPKQDRSDLARWKKAQAGSESIAARIWAEYDGVCRTCGGSIGAGEHIWYDGKDNDGQRTWHEDCLPDGRLEPEE